MCKHLTQSLYEVSQPKVYASLLQVLNQQFMLGLRKKLEYVKDIYPAMLMLIEALTLDVGQSNEMVLDDVTPEASRLILSVSHLYSSHLGVSTIAQSLHQIAVVR
jgi:hypothetical protein